MTYPSTKVRLLGRALGSIAGALIGGVLLGPGGASIGSNTGRDIAGKVVDSTFGR